MKTIATMALSATVAAGNAEDLKPGAFIHGFSVKSVTDVPDVNGRLVRMTYEKNGADLAWLDRDDDNKTFAIVFRTIPGDDTGVPHIIEHSVLCGSEKYPVKEPFVELLKSSFSTFLNAMTAVDFTAYPVCSRNDADFLNLVDVYLDAVFHPLSVKGPLQFRQEGWHYEIKGGEEGREELTRNGVVYSEMKGSFSKLGRLARHELGRLLFPDNCYRFSSGGEPESIPELTFEKYKDFYFRHYHPSNARIFLDGRINLPATLAKLDACLSSFERRQIDTSVPIQRPVASEKTVAYEIGRDDSEADKTVLADGWVVCTWRDLEESAAMGILADALADSNEAPLKKALMEKGLCEDVDLSFIDGQEQNAVHLLVKNVKDGKEDEVRRAVRATLEELAAGGLDHRRLGALIDRSEFRDREMDTGRTPRGLVYGFGALSQWLYGGDPADALRTERIYKSLREKVSQNWFEGLLKRAILENPHHAKLKLTPSRTLAEERRVSEKAKLSAILAGWSPEELARVKEEAKDLELFQKTKDSPGSLARLPRLSLKDIPEIGPVPEWTEAGAQGVKVYQVKTSANGIAYIDLYFELRKCSREDLSDISTLSDMLGELPTSKRSLQELKNELDANLGRFRTDVAVFARPGDARRAKAYFVVSVSALESKLGEIARLVHEILLKTKFDPKLTGDIVKQRRRSIERGIAGIDGRNFAAIRAAASQTVANSVNECFRGVTRLRRLQSVDDSFARDGARFCSRLSSLAERVFARRVITAFVSDNVKAGRLNALFAGFPYGAQGAELAISTLPPRSEGFRTTGNVAGTAKASFPGVCTGTGLVAARILSLDYLWKEIRVLGGAYGGNFGLGASGIALYNSWNDPNPARSLGVYDRSGDALRKAAHELASFDKYIIGAIAATEPYTTPSVDLRAAADLALSGRIQDDLKRLRREMLHTTKDGLLAFADTLDSFSNSPSMCVVGGAAQIESCSNILEKVESIVR